jgi:hypothetical protein
LICRACRSIPQMTPKCVPKGRQVHMVSGFCPLPFSYLCVLYNLANSNRNPRKKWEKLINKVVDNDGLGMHYSYVPRYCPQRAAHKF